MYIGFHVNFSLLLPHFNETLKLSTDFRKNVELLENLSIESRVVSLGLTEGQIHRPDAANSLVCSLTKAPKNSQTQRIFLN